MLVLKLIPRSCSWKNQIKKEIKKRVGVLVISGIKSLGKPVKLADITSNTNLKFITCLKKPRLPIISIKEDYWKTILDMGDSSI